MNWIQMLAETYDNCKPSIGYSKPNVDEEDTKERPLLPICHITTQAHIEIVIDGNGLFRRARLITRKADSTTIIPCTEASASRAGSKPENHPLCDKLQYVAGDFLDYGGEVTSGFAKDPEEPFRNYVAILTKWSSSEFAHPKTQAVLKYVSQKRVIKDLVEQQILFLGDDGTLCNKDEIARDKNAKDIFSVINSQTDAFVRWIVEDDEGVPEVWLDKTLWASWISFYLGALTDLSLCYVTGLEEVVTGNHPKYIRREGDGSKLISSNDTSGFTFRGRFLNHQQAAGVGLETSHKSHNALIWLISRQGYRKGDLAVVAWAKSGAAIPQPTADTVDIFADAPSEEVAPANTAQGVALQLTKRIAGYAQTLGETDHIAVMALDSATPTGRLAITYYRDLTSSDFLERIDAWHKSCAWLHRYRTKEVQDPKSGKTIRKVLPFVGAPAPNDITEAAYGLNVDDKLRKATILRILPCIVDGQPLPRDLMESTARRAANRAGMEEWEWNKTLSIACALFRKYNTKETYDMALDPNRKTRDYLYGRALALADSLEQWALNAANESRPTNAARLMQRFAERPFSTWRSIELALTPYKARLGRRARTHQEMIDEVISSLDPEDSKPDRPLSAEFLLGYHSQREALRASRSKEASAADSDNDADSETDSDSDS